MTEAASWMDDQRRAALADTARLAHSLARGSRAVLIPAPRGPWSTAMLASVATGNALRTVCPHLARASIAVVPHGPRPLVVPTRYRLSCTGCAGDIVRTAGPASRCHGCDRSDRPRLRAVVAHGSILVIIGVLCQDCATAEIGGHNLIFRPK